MFTKFLSQPGVLVRMKVLGGGDTPSSSIPHMPVPYRRTIESTLHTHAPFVINSMRSTAFRKSRKNGIPLLPLYSSTIRTTFPA